MDILKGKKVMVWTFMGNARMYTVLRNYGDCINQIGLFSFKVRATGEIYETGVAISDMLTYINMWPHIKWLLTISNDGYNSIFAALRDNTNGAQDTFLSEIVRIMNKYPWCDGIDIDLEKGDGYSTHVASTAMFRNIYNTVKGYDSSKLMNICLPGMTSVNGSVGGENWCVYADLNNYCDTASIMSYGMAWAGSAPEPVSPRSWLEGIYDYATEVMNPDKVFLGMPAYGWNWQIYDKPANIGKTYRGTSQTYYAAQNWLKGVYNFMDDQPPQPFIPFVGYWDDDNKGPWALPHVYDYMEGRDATEKTYPQLSGTYNGRHYLTAYSKEQSTTFDNILIDRDGTPDSYSGIVSVENGVATLGDNGAATYSFTVSAAGTYDIAVRICYPFWDKNGIYISIDGTTVHFTESRLWWTPTTVRGMISNEKYTGDVIFQKTYTDSQFNRHVNYGQKDQYAMSDHHEAIISREVFEAANALIAQRGKEKGIIKGSEKYQSRYCFSGKIVCGECGDTFKRRIHSTTTHKYAAWCCNTHIEDKSRCSMKYIRDDAVKAAFVTMINKLIFAHSMILKPYVETLQNGCTDAPMRRIQEIQTLLLENAEQRETLTKLMAQGYIDQILYNEENNTLLSQADRYRQEMDTLSKAIGGDGAHVTAAKDPSVLCRKGCHADRLR